MKHSCFIRRLVAEIIVSSPALFLVRCALSIVFGACLMPSASAQIKKGPFDIAEDGAFLLFQTGKLHQAKTRLEGLLATSDAPLRTGWLLRDLMTVCMEAYDTKCVLDALGKAPAVIKAEPQLRLVVPDYLFFEAQVMLWKGNHSYFPSFIQGTAQAITPVPHSTRYFELQVVLADYYLQHLDGASAEEARSMALAGILVTQGNSQFGISKALVDLIESHMEGQDILGALQFYGVSAPYLWKSIPPQSVLFARLAFLTARLLSYTNNYDLTAKSFGAAGPLWDALEIDEGVKQYIKSIGNSLESAALVLANKNEDAAVVHGQHPLQKAREKILQRRSFANATEFYFGVSDLLIGLVQHGRVDPRWLRAFEHRVDWGLQRLPANDVESYRKFALALAHLGTGQVARGRLLAIEAAKTRLIYFDQVLRASYETFQVAGLVDKLVIMAGLTAAASRGSREDIDLMVRGSEALSRNIRHRLVDISVAVASEPAGATRQRVHAYTLLIDKKREWELAQLAQLLNGKEVSAGGVQTDYAATLARLAALKKELVHRGEGEIGGLPTLDALQKSLSDGEAFVGYFSMLGGVGRYCVTKQTTRHAGQPPGLSILADAAIVNSANAMFPASAEEGRIYPVAPSLRLRDFLLGGLDECLGKGMRVTVALPQELTGLSLPSLLQEQPPRLGDGYDLTKAHWLVNDIDSSVVISARHYLAATELRRGHRSNPSRGYLGIGNPQLEGSQEKQHAAMAGLRASVKTPSGIFEFAPLPETATEVKAAATLFSASRPTVLLASSATEESLRSLPLGSYDVVHFATHAVVKDDVSGLGEGALLLTPGDPADKYDDGLLSASEIIRIDLQARLIILSACNTAKYDPLQAGMTVQDLQAAFAVAGAPTLIASLWSVDSPSTVTLITEFIRQWRASPGKPAASALAAAMRAYLGQGHAAHAHPAYWAAFAVIGDGGVTGSDSNLGLDDRDVTDLEYLPGYTSAGEVLSAARDGKNVLFGLYGEWDGSKNNGILSYRDSSGRELWRTASREVGIGRFSILGDEVFVAGYRTIEGFLPVLRCFDRRGRQKWQREFPAFRGYMFADVATTPDGIFVIAYPQELGDTAPQDVVLLRLRRDGTIISQAVLDTLLAKGITGGGARLINWRDKLAIALEFRAFADVAWDTRTRFGVPKTCWRGARTTLYFVDPSSLVKLGVQTIDYFKSPTLAVANGELYVGGELGDGCNNEGVAALFRLKNFGRPSLTWRADPLFVSSIRGIVDFDGRIVLGVRQERAMGVGDKDVKVDYTSKRFSEDLAARREVAFVSLSYDGVLLRRSHSSVALNAFLGGMIVLQQKVVAFGMLGGRPATTPFSGRRTYPRTEKPPSPWYEDLLGKW